MRFRVLHIIYIVIFLLVLSSCGKKEAPAAPAPAVTTDPAAEPQDTPIPTGTLPEERLPDDILRIVAFAGIDVSDYDGSMIRENDRDLAYETELVRSLCDLPYWKALGTAEVAFEHKPSKTVEEVTAFIDAGTLRGFESLAEPFFWTDYNTPETIEYAQAYAYYLTEYAVRNHSFPEFAAGNYREEWLANVGSTDDYIHDAYNALLENALYSVEDSVHVITVGGIKWICDKVEWIGDSAALYDLIYDSLKDFDAIKADIMTDAPQWYEAHKFPSDIWVRFYNGDEDDPVSSYTTPSLDGRTKIITLSAKCDLAHEYVHALTSRTSGTDLRWLKEGIAEFYSNRYSGRYRLTDPKNAEFFRLFTEGEYDESFFRDTHEPDVADHIIAYYACVKEKYDELKSLYPSSLNDYWYIKLAISALEMERNEVDPAINYTVAEAYNMSEGASHGSSAFTELDKHISYETAAVLSGLLIRDHGADAVLEYLHTGGNFKRRFGTTSEDFYQKVLEEGVDYSVFFKE